MRAGRASIRAGNPLRRKRKRAERSSQVQIDAPRKVKGRDIDPGRLTFGCGGKIEVRPSAGRLPCGQYELASILTGRKSKFSHENESAGISVPAPYKFGCGGKIEVRPSAGRLACGQYELASILTGRKSKFSHENESAGISVPA